MPMYPTNKSSNVTQNIETYTLKLHVIPHKSCATVLVSEQIKHVNSQLPKASNQLKNPTSDHVFKILSSLMKSITNF
jgi:MinD-like ATPase involved in chromosome partitioning or flagellar assembly